MPTVNLGCLLCRQRPQECGRAPQPLSWTALGIRQRENAIVKAVQARREKTAFLWIAFDFMIPRGPSLRYSSSCLPMGLNSCLCAPCWATPSPNGLSLSRSDKTSLPGRASSCGIRRRLLQRPLSTLGPASRSGTNSKVLESGRPGFKTLLHVSMLYRQASYFNTKLLVPLWQIGFFLH